MSLKLNMFMKSVDVVNDNIKKDALRIILWSFAFLAVLYLIFLGIMVDNIVERRSLEARARNLSSEVGDMELTYLSMSDDVDLALSHSMGFGETKAIFATRKAIGLRSDGEASGLKIAKNDI